MLLSCVHLFVHFIARHVTNTQSRDLKRLALRSAERLLLPLTALAFVQLGMVFLTGPLAEIVQTAQEILDKAGRGELSAAFRKVIGAG